MCFGSSSKSARQATTQASQRQVGGTRIEGTKTFKPFTLTTAEAIPSQGGFNGADPKFGGLDSNGRATTYDGLKIERDGFSRQVVYRKDKISTEAEYMKRFPTTAQSGGIPQERYEYSTKKVGTNLNSSKVVNEGELRKRTRGVRSNAGASGGKLAKSKRQGNLRIDNVGAQSSSGSSGVNIPK